MKPIFKICKTGSNTIKVVGLEREDHQYSDTLVDKAGVFSYADTVTINIFSSLNHQEEVIDLQYNVNKHNSLEDCSEFSFTRDGVYRIHHIILPTLNWYSKVLEKKYDLSKYGDLYIYSDERVFKIVNNIWNPIDIKDIPFIDPLINATLTFDIQYTFNSYQLQECYYKFCKSYFDNLDNICDEKDSQFIKNRDLLWMSINVIKYLLDFGRLFEAQKIIEKLYKCSNLCYHTKKIVTNEDCGCSG